MRRVYVFGDEAGDFVFKPPDPPSISRYFVIGTVTMGDCKVGDELLDLRRELAWNGLVLDGFHATSDKQRVRDRVFDLLASASFRFDATVLDKTKTRPYLQQDPLRFYKTAWYLHFKYVAPRVARSLDELMVVASSLRIKRQKQAIHRAVRDVVSQVSPTAVFQTAFSPAACDPCLQVADYMTWAVQRKFERADRRSYDLVAHNISSVYQPFGMSSESYYAAAA